MVKEGGTYGTCHLVKHPEYRMFYNCLQAYLARRVFIVVTESPLRMYSSRFYHQHLNPLQIRVMNHFFHQTSENVVLEICVRVERNALLELSVMHLQFCTSPLPRTAIDLFIDCSLQTYLGISLSQTCNYIQNKQ